MLVLKLFSDPRHESRFDLDGRTFVFTFVHNARIDRWYVTITTESGEAVAGNRKLVTGLDDMFALSSVRLRPPGKLRLISIDPTQDVPTLHTLTESFALVYGTDI